MRFWRLMLAIGVLLPILDSVAAGVNLFGATMGVTGTENGTVSKSAADHRATLAAIDDYSIQVDLIAAFHDRATLLRGTSLYPVLQGGLIHRALDRHYGLSNNGNLNAFLKANDARVHPNLRLIGMQIDQENAFAPTVLDPVASYNGTGAEAGTFVAGSNIDTTQYGKSAMEVVVGAMGVAARTLRLTMIKADNSTESKDVIVPGGSAVNSVVAIGAASDRYIGVSGITTAPGGGGQNGDVLRVRSKIERVIAL